MELQLDHVFILVESEAKVADLLIAKGFIIGKSRQHSGQGTTNRSFYFANGMLELLWVRDIEEATSGVAKDLRFYDRFCDHQASPFGIIVRKSDRNSSGRPFSGWHYQPIYFQPPQGFHIGSNSQNLREPLCIYASFKDVSPTVDPTITINPQDIISVTIQTTELDQSEVLKTINQAQRLEIKSGSEHLMEIKLKSRSLSESQTLDFRPHIPLILNISN